MAHTDQDTQSKVERTVENMDNSKKEQILADFDTFKSYLNDKVSAGKRVGLGEEQLAIAAEKAGFGSEVTYRRAKAVVRDGVPELQEAMDDGSLTISAAFEISKLPEEEQVQILAEGPESAKQRAKEVRKSKSKKEATPKEDKPEKPKVNPDALKEGIFPAHIVAHQVKSMIDKIAWRDPKAVASLDIILTHAQRRKEDILKRVENDER